MAYWVGALTISVLFATAGLTCAFGTREEKGGCYFDFAFSYMHNVTEQQSVNKKVSFFQGLKLTMKFRPYFYLVMMYMFGWVAVNVSETIAVIGHVLSVLLRDSVAGGCKYDGSVSPCPLVGWISGLK